MFDIIKLLFDICLFKKGPQDLPYSLWLLRLLLVVYVSVRVLMLSIHFDWLNVLLQVIVDIILVAGFFWIMLYLARKLGRFYQVLSTAFGTDALISFIALPGMATMETGHGGLLGDFGSAWVNRLALGGYRAYYSQCAGEKPKF